MSTIRGVSGVCTNVNTMGDTRRQAVFEGQPLDPLATLYESEYVRLVGLAHWVVGNRQMAEELVQETFVRLVEQPPRLDDPTLLDAYVRSALMNRTRSKLRRLVLERRHATADVDIAVDQLPDQQVRDAVMTLPLRQRQCVALRFYDDQTVPEIARALGVSAGSVKTHLHRGLQTLARLLDEAPPSEDKP